jgi:DNA polymerase-3 subunit gamma/tau
LKEIVKGDKEVKETETHQVQEKTLTAPFDEHQLVQAWDHFIDTINEKVYLKNTMINCKPTLLKDFQFEVAVHNPGQQNELAANSLDLLSYLRTTLNNTQIQMQTRIVETNEKHLAYTSTERHEYLLKQNPVLARLKEEFNLRLD